MAEREVVPLGPEITPLDRLENGPEVATTPHNQPRPSEEVGRPRREVRKPVRYQDYECYYTLQPAQGCLQEWEIAMRSDLQRKGINFQEKIRQKGIKLFGPTGASSYLDQSEASKHRQTTPPYWPCDQLDIGALPDNTYCKKILDINDYRLTASTMSKESYKGSEYMEKVLQELLEELTAMILL